MRKSVLAAIVGSTLAAIFCLQCGKSNCKKYAERFCADEKSPICAQTREKIKSWSSDKCRIELNEILIDEQSKQLEQELK
jgi:hypothetical protein